MALVWSTIIEQLFARIWRQTTESHSGMNCGSKDEGKVRACGKADLEGVVQIRVEVLDRRAVSQTTKCGRVDKNKEMCTKSKWHTKDVQIICKIPFILTWASCEKEESTRKYSTGMARYEIGGYRTGQRQ